MNYIKLLFLLVFLQSNVHAEVKVVMCDQKGINMDSSPVFQKTIMTQLYMQQVADNDLLITRLDGSSVSIDGDIHLNEDNLKYSSIFNLEGSSHGHAECWNRSDTHYHTLVLSHRTSTTIYNWTIYIGSDVGYIETAPVASRVEKCLQGMAYGLYKNLNISNFPHSGLQVKCEQ